MKISYFLLGILAVMACTTNPITGRSSLQLVDNANISSMAAQEYQKTLTESKVITGTAQAKSVQVVGNKIKSAAEKYYRNIGREKDLLAYNWQFTLIENNQQNAWCMPGGKVAVYTGILPITKDETGLAVVMGHEVSHALAGHGNERITQAMIAQTGGALLSGALSKSQWSGVFNKVYPIGAQVGLLAYGRSQELEADQMGLYLMAMAGYDPRETISFWERMNAASGGKKSSPEFLSTHPGSENRIAKLNQNMNVVLEYYKANGGKL